MRKEDLQTVLFGAVVCVVCSLIISGAAAALKSRQDINIETDRRLNVLQAFGVETVVDGKKLNAEEVQSIFDKNIREVIVDAQTGDVLEGVKSSDISPEEIYLTKTKLAVYKWMDGDQIKKLAFPLAGMGLWSTVYSYIALEDDFATIKGATFYGHKETPGLGGECSAPWFMQQFSGKKVFDENGNPLHFEIVKGAVSDKYPDGNDHAVDGISGATMTGNGIQKFINEGMSRYNIYLEKLRQS